MKTLSQLDTFTRAYIECALWSSNDNAKSYMESEKMNRLGGVRYGNKRANRGAYTITAAHEEVVNAMPALLEGKITPEEAMALLHGYDIKNERLG